MVILITLTINPETAFISELRQSLEHLTDINCCLFGPLVQTVNVFFLWAWGRGGGGWRGGGRWWISPCRLLSAPPALTAAPGFQQWLPPSGFWPPPDCSPEGCGPPAVSLATPPDPRSAPSSLGCPSAGSLDGGGAQIEKECLVFHHFFFLEHVHLLIRIKLYIDHEPLRPPHLN